MRTAANLFFLLHYRRTILDQRGERRSLSKRVYVKEWKTGFWPGIDSMDELSRKYRRDAA